jgi:glycosyltransferase involved in cell wall biosynthesis
VGKAPLQQGFGVFFDPSKTTSGQRFFSDLYQELSKEELPLEQKPQVVLFNISAPWREVVKAKLRGQKVVVRVDGLYFDRLSPAFIARFRWPLQVLFRLGLKYQSLHDPLAHVANMLDQNYGGFFRIVFADHVIYQSRFSHAIHQIYFSGKSSSIIVNGSRFRAAAEAGREQAGGQIRLVTVFDEGRPSKRMYEIVQFVHWLNEKKLVRTSLTMLGYAGTVPEFAPGDMASLIEASPFIKTLPRFREFQGEVGNVLESADCYISFSFRDSCPNSVIECMAYGLPVIGVASGGLPDIVGNAGRLVDIDDDSSGGFFTAHRMEYDFPPIDFEQVYAALQEIIQDRDAYLTNVQRRFAEQLDIDVVAARYASVLRQIADYRNACVVDGHTPGPVNSKLPDA